ncbi:uncharacterized protein LOC135115848 isoform X2 [Scylla paramamosain]|uniref:uncharacterized protein LOC135115848 isoform X2 n=1 Tax=Scylla paramamosain TaxID=85552 RepID=UPI003083EA62
MGANEEERCTCDTNKSICPSPFFYMLSVCRSLPNVEHTSTTTIENVGKSRETSRASRGQHQHSPATFPPSTLSKVRYFYPFLDINSSKYTPYRFIISIRMIVTRIIPEGRALQVVLRRNYGVSAVLMKKVADPIQQLFVDKIHEYNQKSKTTGGKLVDATPAIEKQMQQELDKVARQYGGGAGVDMTKFPDFKFEDPKVDMS